MFRFTIRELALATVIVGLAMGWLREAASNKYESAYLRGAADEKEYWLHEFESLQSKYGQELKVLRAELEMARDHDTQSAAIGDCGQSAAK